ncbi:MAG: hypothetical protein H6R00_2889 [Proteobacteria bacterium]|nr:hypothetical protein [Pseudomonadota bacterium]
MVANAEGLAENAGNEGKGPPVAFRNGRFMTMGMLFNAAEGRADIVRAFDDFGRCARDKPVGGRRQAGDEIRRIAEPLISEQAEEMMSPQPHCFSVGHDVG